MGQIGRSGSCRLDWFLAFSSSRTGVSLAIVPSINITRVTSVAEVALYKPRSVSASTMRIILELRVNVFSQSTFLSTQYLDKISFVRSRRNAMNIAVLDHFALLAAASCKKRGNFCRCLIRRFLSAPPGSDYQERN